MPRSISRLFALGLTTALVLSTGAAVLAQDEAPPTTTISAVERGEATGAVYMEGAALDQVDDDEYFFSDGTGVITIDVDENGGEIPLFTLIGITGTVASDEIDVSEWAPLPIVTPAVIVPEEKVIEAFWGWIVAYGGQAPAE